jgi:hypothetical protein
MDSPKAGVSPELNAVPGFGGLNAPAEPLSLRSGTTFPANAARILPGKPTLDCVLGFADQPQDEQR